MQSQKENNLCSWKICNIKTIWDISLEQKQLKLYQALNSYQQTRV